MSIDSWFGSDENLYVRFGFSDVVGCGEFYDNLFQQLKSCIVEMNDYSITICYSNILLEA